MDFSISPATTRLLDAVREWLATYALPLERELLEGRWEELEPGLEPLRADVKSRGWWLPQLSAEHGGMGLELVDFGLLGGELGRSPLGHYLFNCQAPDAGNLEILAELATPAQRKRFFEPLARGDIRSCFGMTEPDNPGSNPVRLSTRAERRGEEYVISGRKWFVTGAEGAAFCVVMVVTDPDADRHRRASMLLVPTDTPGYRLVRNVPHMGEAGSGWTSHGEVAFEECRVPVTHRLGEEGDGFRIAQQRLGPGRIHHCMRWLGICERALELTCRRALERELEPGRPLARESLIQQWIGQSRAEIDASRWAVLHAAWLIQQQGARAARAEISAIKFQVAGTLERVLDRAVQVHGALGVSDDTPLAFFFRQERAARIYDGPDEVHQLALARRELKKFE